MGLFSSAAPKAASSWNPLNWGSSSSAPASGLSSLLPGGSGGSASSWATLAFGTKDQKWFQTLLGKFGVSGAVATILSFFLYFLYLKFVKKDNKALSGLLKGKFSECLHKIPGLNKIPFLKKLLPDSKSLIHIPKGTQAALGSIAGTAPGILTKLNPLNWKVFNKEKIAEEEDDEKYQAGEPYGDPNVMAIGIMKDLRSRGLKTGVSDLRTLLQLAKTKGKMNDRDMVMEKLIAIASSLPRESKARGKLTGILVDSLWKSLQHPPMSYLGNKYQYRTADGSYNNPLQPDLGKAGSPYARTVPKLKHTHGVPPDPGLLFDLLMARSDDTFQENPAGISSVLFYHATIIIHDVFRTNRFDSNVSDTSSYLDLAPLYGSNRKDQEDVRAMKNGLLKPDAFAEKRLLGMPPGVNVMLIMYNRFHNYVADVLLKINENGRFTLPPTRTEEAKQAAIAKQDEDVFQTARLVVNGLYVNISLHDYLRGLTNSHHSATDWTLDPRVEVARMFDPEGVPRGIGNQVSAEFNLLYRFHSVISRRDEKWTNEFLRTLFPGDKPLDQLTPQEFIQGLLRFEQSIPEDPGVREFGGMKRGSEGKFNDEELVNVMKESMEDPAGLFGARMVPKALRMIEVAGILTSRKWNLASLNEMRKFFGLKRHDTFEDINPDPAVADLLRKLYDHPDMVEMYPGLFLEDAKPRMDPGCGGCPPYTVGRAVFSDAVTLVRSDRFCTIDYTASNLTCWGIQEVQQDYDILGGSMFHKLFQRAFPGWFPYNSLHSTQPMFTRKMNEEIAREIGTIDQYTLAGPSPPPTPVVVAKHSTVTKVLNDQANFRIIWTKYLNDMVPGKKYDSYMLGGDKPANTAQRNMVSDIMFSPAEFMQLLSQTSVAVGKELLEAETLNLRKDLEQVDIIRDVAIPLNTRILADLFSLDLKTSENEGGSLHTAQLYKYLIDVRTYGFNNNDPAVALQRRKLAREGAEALDETTLKVVSGGSNPLTEADHKGIVSKVTGAVSGAVTGVTGAVKGAASHLPLVGKLFGGKKGGKKGEVATGSLRWYGQNVMREIIASGKTPEEAAEISWLSAVAGVGAPVGLFADVLHFFLQEKNSQHWEEIQNLAASSNIESADKTLRQYVLEAQRFTSEQKNVRICVGKTTIDGRTFKPNDVVACLFGYACKDPDVFPDPETFKLDRPDSSYIHFSTGPHSCLGREVCLAFVVSLIRITAGLKNLRPAPGAMGTLKQINVKGDRCYLNDSWSFLTFDPTTWKLHYDGQGKGVYHSPKIPVNAGHDLNAVSNALIQQQEDFVANGGSKKENGVPDPANGATNPANPTNVEYAAANVPVPADAPAMNGLNGQQAPLNDGGSVAFTGPISSESVQQAPVQSNQIIDPLASYNQKQPGFLHQAASNAIQLPQKAIGTAHDTTHSAIGNVPGGQQAQQFTHNLVGNLVPGSSPNGQQQQQQQKPSLFTYENPLNTATQGPQHRGWM